MEYSCKQELAFLYLHGELKAELKPTVFELILHDEKFRQCLKEEVAFREKMSKFRQVLPQEAYDRMLADLRNQVEIERIPSKKTQGRSKYP
ncbi:MAG: hypothetical protein K6T85_13795, partial [Gorillibacterium sp.]|nr:hypothetical protein [Gorillibacterium sp.]